MSILDAINNEDKLIAQCNGDKAQAHRIACQVEKNIKQLGDILSLMLPEVFKDAMSKNNPAEQEQQHILHVDRRSCGGM